MTKFCVSPKASTKRPNDQMKCNMFLQNLIYVRNVICNMFLQNPIYVTNVLRLKCNMFLQNPIYVRNVLRFARIQYKNPQTKVYICQTVNK